MTILPKYVSLLVGLWELLFKIGILVSRLKLSRDSGFSSKIDTIPPNSGRLDSLQGFLGGPGDVSPEKIRNLRSSNCWKCTEMVNLTVTVLFLYHFKYFTISSGGPFFVLGGRGGGGVRAHPAHPPPLPTGLPFMNTTSFFSQFLDSKAVKVSTNKLSDFSYWIYLRAFLYTWHMSVPSLVSGTSDKKHNFLDYNFSAFLDMKSYYWSSLKS